MKMPTIVRLFTQCAFITSFLIGAGDLTAKQLIQNPTFSEIRQMAPWWSTNNVDLSYEDRGLCAKVASPTENPWDALVGLSDISLEKGEIYHAKTRLHATQFDNVSAKIQLAKAPWTTFYELETTVQDGENLLEVKFTSDQSYADLQLVIELGGPEARLVCVAEISLIQVSSEPVLTQTNEISLKINQHGYLPKGPKFANLVQPDDDPVQWQLKQPNGEIVATGMSQPLGFDPSSALKSHLIDFSDLQFEGQNFVLWANGAQSHPFAISYNLYDQMRRDALSYFYLARSGTDISGAIAGRVYGRPAGHVGDQAISCLSQDMAQEIYGKAWPCDYRLNVSGGWYDAGDFGKYVVNGGIAVAQLLATYEHALWFKGASSPILQQDYANIDNSSQILPDILAEVKWQLDFMMNMQVPSGPYRGMVHHKIHGIKWNKPPLWPHRDDIARALHPPSTAATLNLAAVTAQAARIYAPYDKTYAEKLFQVAQNAYRAAKQNPDILAPDTNGAHGGGDYTDKSVSDEFYWAASELFITSEQEQFLSDLKASPHWQGKVYRGTGMTWDYVAGWARLQLALSPNALTHDDRTMVQQSVLDAATIIAKIQDHEAFGLMFPAADGLPWGSNNNILQNMIITGAAYHLTGDKQYLRRAQQSMDYILGRNAIGQSYITGYGTTYAREQHSRIFAQQLDRNFPPMPKGSLAGGPNSWMSDPYIKKVRQNCAPQACYVDDSRSYSTNEIAINWNAGLAYITSFLADFARE